MNIIGSLETLTIGMSGSLRLNSTLDLIELALGSISQTTGILSVFVWLFAQIPQVIENHLNESVSGVSLLFFLFWVAGDSTNLIGCLLTRALPFQICISVYYCFIDLILGIQYWYYTKIYPRQRVHHNLFASPTATAITPLIQKKKHHHTSRRNRFEEDLNRSPIEITNSPYGMNNSRSGFFKKLLSSSLMGSLTKKANAYPITETSSKETTEPFWKYLSHGPVALWGFILQLFSRFHFESYQIGIYSAWLCSFCYLSSRTPQILKNYHSKSTAGISLFLFLFAMLGNTLYTISVMTNLYLVYLNDVKFHESEFTSLFWSQLPFIVGSSGTVIFDCIILFQFKCYSTKTRNSFSSSNKSSKDKSSHNHHNHSDENNSPIHFQKPDWYTNNSLFSDAAYGPFQEENVNRENSREAQAQYASETSPLIRFEIPRLSYDGTMPPPHYVSGHSNNSTYTPPNGILSSTLNALASSFSRSNSNLHNRTPNPINLPYNSNGVNTPLTTSALPSLISSYYLVSRRKSEHQKIPFSPIDFLNDKYYQESHLGDQNHNDIH